MAIVKHRWIIVSLLVAGLGEPLRAQVVEARPIVFAFEVEITLSDKAAMRLKMRRESIVVSADYTGAPKKDAEGRPIEAGTGAGAGGRRVNDIGMVDLGVENVEVIGAEGLVKVSGTRIDLRRLDWMRGPVMLNVSVFSGRHSSEDNILGCDFFDGRLSSAVRKTPVLHCSLLEEGRDPKHRH